MSPVLSQHIASGIYSAYMLLYILLLSFGILSWHIVLADVFLAYLLAYLIGILICSISIVADNYLAYLVAVYLIYLSGISIYGVPISHIYNGISIWHIYLVYLKESGILSVYIFSATLNNNFGISSAICSLSISFWQVLEFWQVSHGMFICA